MAQPLALRTGPRLRFLIFRQAMNMEGPEMTSMMPMMTASSCQMLSEATPPMTATRKLPRKPRARPMAAKMPANLATSKLEVTAAPGAGFSPSFPVAVSAALVRSPMDLSFLAEAFLSTLSEIQRATFLYGAQKA